MGSESIAHEAEGELNPIERGLITTLKTLVLYVCLQFMNVLELFSVVTLFI